MGTSMYLYELSKNIFIKEGKIYTDAELYKIGIFHKKLNKFFCIDSFFDVIKDDGSVCNTIKNNSKRIIKEEPVFLVKSIIEIGKVENISKCEDDIVLEVDHISKIEGVFILYDKKNQQRKTIKIRKEEFAK